MIFVARRGHNLVCSGIKNLHTQLRSDNRHYAMFT
jgi:hypothetical protein